VAAGSRGYPFLAPPIACPMLPRPTEGRYGGSVTPLAACVATSWSGCASELRRNHDQSPRVRRSRAAHQLLYGTTRGGRPSGTSEDDPDSALYAESADAAEVLSVPTARQAPQSSGCTTWAWVGHSWFFCT
jgi:hypothetical protein